jgi:predicted NBD/HSP70 family sugar kinase
MPPSTSTHRVARQDWMREHNLSLALAAVVDSPEPVSRAQLAARTGLSRAAVTGLVDRLVESGLVSELAPLSVSRAGRPAVPLVPAAGSVVGLGLEVNVDYLGVRAVDLTGTVLAEVVEHGDLRGTAPETVLARLALAATSVNDAVIAAGARPAGATLALPGLVDAVGERLLTAPNLGWREVNVGPGSALGAFTPSVANEADLAARAELRARRGHGEPNFFYVSGEIGVGGATVLGGQVQTGRHGWAGEIGHVVVSGDPDDRRSLRRLEDLAGQHALLQGAGLPIATPFATLTARVASDPGAARAARTGGRALGVALATVAHVADIDEVVLGGTFAELFDVVAPEVTAMLTELVVYVDWAAPKVSRALAGNYAALTGAALSVLDRMIAHPSAWT